MDAPKRLAILNAIEIHNYSSLSASWFTKQPLAIDWPDVLNKNQTFLMKAVAFPEILQKVLDRCPDVNLQDSEGHSVLHYMLEAKSTDSLRILLNQDWLDFSIITGEGKTIFDYEPNRAAIRRYLHFGYVQATVHADRVGEMLRTRFCNEISDIISAYTFLPEFYRASSPYRVQDLRNINTLRTCSDSAAIEEDSGVKRG